jgi:hypothetical protein
MNLIMELLDSLHNCCTNSAQGSAAPTLHGAATVRDPFYLVIFILFILLIKIFI